MREIEHLKSKFFLFVINVQGWLSYLFSNVIMLREICLKYIWKYQIKYLTFIDYMLKCFNRFFFDTWSHFPRFHFRQSVVKQPYNSFISTAVLIFRILYFAQKRVIKSQWKIVCAKSSKRINKTIKNNPGFVGVISFLYNLYFIFFFSSFFLQFKFKFACKHRSRSNLLLIINRCFVF